MSRQGHSLPDVSIQKADINSQLNATLLGIFMMGMHTIVYVGTMFICLNGKVSQGKPVLLTISLLYVFALIGCSFEWAFLHWFFLTNGHSTETTFVSLLLLPRWMHVMNNLFAFAMLFLADGLLIWRTFNVWARSLRVIFLPLFLYVAEIGLFISALIILFVTHAHPTRSQALTINRIESAGYLVSAIASLSATFLIACRITSLSIHGPVSESKARFNHVIEIIVQSVVVYSLALVVQAVAVVVPFSARNERVFALEVYSSAILIPIAGIAPTIMVARVSLSANADRAKLWPSMNDNTKTRKATTLRFRTDHTSILDEAEHDSERVIDIRTNHDRDYGETEKDVPLDPSA